MERKKIALLAVADKAGIAKFGRLVKNGDWEIVSTGGTGKALSDAGVPFTEIGDFTGFPDLFNGRLKTFHPKVHGGLLFLRGNPVHEEAAKKHGIVPIDLVVANLYDFSGRPSIENLSLGGTGLIRSAAANACSVGIVTDPNDYEPIIAYLLKCDELPLGLRARLAAEAFDMISKYDAEIARWMKEEVLGKERYELLGPAPASGC